MRLGGFPGGRDWTRNKQGAKAMLRYIEQKKSHELKPWERKTIKIILFAALICQIIYSFVT
ncbi:MAG: hypothetical protein FH758_01860 [Firmicutes bacterium]|nr:hypothetical protein [Bacillota bacterium]